MSLNPEFLVPKIILSLLTTATRCVAAGLTSETYCCLEFPTDHAHLGSP